MTMELTKLEGNVPIIRALVELFGDPLEDIIDELNEADKTYEIPQPVQVVPYIPMLSILSGGMPIIGIGDMPSTYEDDLQFSMFGKHKVAVMMIMNHSDHLTLTEYLRKYQHAVQLTIQQDREKPLHGEEPLLSGPKHGGILYTRFVATEPGPLLGEVNPQSADTPPTTYISWTGLALELTRTEI